MDSIPEPQLAPPGAGLPKPELYIGRLLFAVNRWAGNRTTFDARFQLERQKIRELLATCPPDACGKRVLIARPRGMEDSSRYWSIWMTLDHLRIIHRSFMQVITQLSQGKTPAGRASTANVKPSTSVNAAVVGDYEKSCDDLLATVASIPNLKTGVRYLHPWFGSLDAAGWHAIAGTHLAIHRVQIERIIAGLGDVRRQ
ncbi:MAG TPA: DinB family protein [Candidatus Limnocylindria bacterium]|nr:DinB family protein [Candidatus Limnocylindria bacterium]